MEASKEDDPHRWSNPSKEAVTQMLKKQWSGNGRRVAKGRGKVSPCEGKAGNGETTYWFHGFCAMDRRGTGS